MKIWSHEENESKILNKFRLSSLILFGGGAGTLMFLRGEKD